MLCPGWQKMAWDVLSRDVLSYILTDRPAMTIAVDLGRKATKQTKKQNKHFIAFFFNKINKFRKTGT